MNRGVLQSSPVQQMMTGNPNWWNININSMAPQAPPFLSTPNNFPIPCAPTSLPFPSWHENQDLPESWSQLLMSGVVDEQGKAGMGQFIQTKKLESWEDQMLGQAPNASLVDVKQENLVNSYAYGHGSEELQSSKPSWSPKSCVTTSFSSNMLDFSNNKTDARHPPPDLSSEVRKRLDFIALSIKCNSTAAGGALKKARVQPSATTQTTFKVRKEKLGERITALHQLVSPFGKTDTASVLLEAIGYIRFLQSQIEALSLPYLSGGSGNTRQQHSVQGEKTCIFPEDPGQLLDENCLKRKAAGEPDTQEEPKKGLRSRGLCLVPVSCTLQVGSDNGADYWAPALGGGFR
ncbi:Transcription factor bHLH68 [Glycine max]|nr:Transcription factor bHLH68 [Glycine max]